MSQLILYNYFRSSTSYRVRIALHHKSLQFEYKPVHLLNNGGEHHTSEYHQLNPQEEVPTLVHNGKAIAQSFAIIEYLDEVFPQNRLFPQVPFERAKVRQFCENINSFMHPLSNLKVLQYLEKHHGYDLPKKESWVQHWLTQGLRACEEMLAQHSGQFCFGDQVTAADIFLIPQVFTANRFKVSLADYPHINRINTTCEKLDAFARAHPSKQIDAS